MITYSTDKPKGESLILAKLTMGFTLGMGGYEILAYQKQMGIYYDSAGEEIPLGAIEKYAIIET